MGNNIYNLRLIGKDDIKPVSFENVKEDYEWLEKTTGISIVDNINNKYSFDNIFNTWINERDVNKILGHPISINQYSKVLREFTKFGRIMYFPEAEIEKIMCNAIKKTILIVKISAMCGMFTYLPIDFIKNTLLPYYSDFIGEPVELQNDGYTIQYTSTIKKLMKRYNIEQNSNNLENKILEYFNDIFWNIHFGPNNGPLKTFIDVDTTNKIQQTKEFWKCIFPNSACDSYPIINIKENQDKTITLKATTMLATMEIGFMQDFKGLITEQLGLSYLFYYLKQLHNDMSNEEMIIWLNKIMHVYHTRSMLSNYFIEGGAEALDKIENGLKE